MNTDLIDDGERKWHLAARALTDSLSPDEALEWEAFLSNVNFRNDFNLLKKHWNTIGELPYDKINVSEDWEHVWQKVEQYQPRKRSRTLQQVWKLAAVITAFIAIAFAGWFALQKQSDTDVLATVIEAPIGARTLVTLPDSSTVWLNAASKISFDHDFGKENRDITIKGEAFFDVKKKETPFKVHTDDYDVVVLGTAFNIKAYPDDEVSSTTLLRGSLKVIHEADGKQEEYLLTPNDRVSITRNPLTQSKSEMVLERSVDSQAEADWKNGWLTIRGESLTGLSRRIERMYNVKIQIQDESLKEYRYTGRIQQLSLEQVLNILALTSPVKFKIQGETVRLTVNEQTRAKYFSQQRP